MKDGRFRVVAGDGRDDYGSSDGRAIDAELSSPSNLAFTASGDPYFVDGRGSSNPIGREVYCREWGSHSVDGADKWESESR
ncbi:MAG: hypothetical protein ACRDVC_10585 [Acidimicrobiales bacterium]